MTPKTIPSKYGPWDVFPSCVKEDGVRPIADGVKPFEIMPIKDWILWGTQSIKVILDSRTPKT